MPAEKSTKIQEIFNEINQLLQEQQAILKEDGLGDIVNNKLVIEEDKKRELFDKFRRDVQRDSDIAFNYVAQEAFSYNEPKKKNREISKYTDLAKFILTDRATTISPQLSKAKDDLNDLLLNGEEYSPICQQKILTMQQTLTQYEELISQCSSVKHRMENIRGGDYDISTVALAEKAKSVVLEQIPELNNQLRNFLSDTNKVNDFIDKFEKENQKYSAQQAENLKKRTLIGKFFYNKSLSNIASFLEDHWVKIAIVLALAAVTGATFGAAVPALAASAGVAAAIGPFMPAVVGGLAALFTSLNFVAVIGLTQEFTHHFLGNRKLLTKIVDSLAANKYRIVALTASITLMVFSAGIVNLLPLVDPVGAGLVYSAIINGVGSAAAYFFGVGIFKNIQDRFLTEAGLKDRMKKASFLGKIRLGTALGLVRTVNLLSKYRLTGALAIGTLTGGAIIAAGVLAPLSAVNLASLNMAIGSFSTSAVAALATIAAPIGAIFLASTASILSGPWKVKESYAATFANNKLKSISENTIGKYRFNLSDKENITAHIKNFLSFEPAPAVKDDNAKAALPDPRKSRNMLLRNLLILAVVIGVVVATFGVGTPLLAAAAPALAPLLISSISMAASVLLFVASTPVLKDFSNIFLSKRLPTVDKIIKIINVNRYAISFAAIGAFSIAFAPGLAALLPMASPIAALPFYNALITGVASAMAFFGGISTLKSFQANFIGEKDEISWPLKIVRGVINKLHDNKNIVSLGIIGAVVLPAAAGVGLLAGNIAPLAMLANAGGASLAIIAIAPLAALSLVSVFGSNNSTESKAFLDSKAGGHVRKLGKLLGRKRQVHLAKKMQDAKSSATTAVVPVAPGFEHKKSVQQSFPDNPTTHTPQKNKLYL